ncbi:MAG TPA: hypothetical protein VMZ91_14400 [Candidatus Paceibacterota bacterium]|nr:hypothetical protein [Candidatus Paceibacterota bacterium]
MDEKEKNYALTDHKDNVAKKVLEKMEALLENNDNPEYREGVMDCMDAFTLLTSGSKPYPFMKLKKD